jgi:hypothetical protein
MLEATFGGVLGIYDLFIATVLAIYATYRVSGRARDDLYLLYALSTISRHHDTTELF